MSIMYFFAYIYMLLKPFYVFPSGGIQPADIFLVISFFCILLNPSKKKYFGEIVFKNRKFLIFLVLSFLVNFIYFIIYLKFKFILSSIYFMFNFMAIIVFSYIFNDKKAIAQTSKILKSNIIIQLLIFMLGLGRIYGQARYMGTFNDPNQFGYYLLTSYILIYLIAIKEKNNKGNLIYLFLTIFLIIQCASTGMLAAILIFLVLQFYLILKNVKKVLRKYGSILILISTFAILVIIICVLLFGNTLKSKFDNILILDRIVEKFNRIENKSASNISIIQERGYDRFIYYPKYVLYGSGEGEYTRFTKTFHQDEIHATFPSILFYYGIIPTLFLISWVFDNVKKSKIKVLIAFISIFLESFTLLNQRQVMFWIIILFISFVNKNNYDIDFQSKTEEVNV